jgi:hypothetical protein
LFIISVDILVDTSADTTGVSNTTTWLLDDNKVRFDDTTSVKESPIFFKRFNWGRIVTGMAVLTK